MNILVVDDAREIRLLLENYLRQSGYDNIEFVTNGEELMIKITEKDLTACELDLILLDVVLPDMNGVEICRCLKMEPAMQDIPIIMVTGKQDDQTLREAFEAGAMDYIKKPISKIELKARVASALRLRKEIKKRNARERELKEATRKLKVANKKLEKLASQDELTGLANRRLFEERLNEEWNRARREDSSMGLIMLDIDHFKYYNDLYGHQAGDDCIKKLAEKLEKLLYRPGDLVARYGGEEFAAILPKTVIPGVERVAERIRKGVRDLEIEHEDSPVDEYVTVSVGGTASNYCREGEPEMLVEKADKALYAAKKDGRNCVKVFAADFCQ